MEPTKDISKPLSQSEIDAILSSLSVEQVSSGSKVQPFNFNKQDVLSPEKLRRLRTKHESLIHSLNSTISLFVRKDFTLRITRLETITHDNLLEVLPGNTHLTLFRLDPLQGAGLLEITPQLGLSVVARMLGSQGHVVRSDREFTEIELRLLGQFAEVVLREYTAMWRGYEQQLNVVVVGYENSARFLKLGAPESLIIFLAMEARFGDTTGYLRVAVPYLTVEPLVHKLITELLTTAPVGESHSPAMLQPEIPEAMLDVPINVNARWEGMQLTVQELRQLRKDDVFVLDENISDRTRLYMGDALKFVGQTGRKGDRLAVRITSKV